MLKKYVFVLTLVFAIGMLPLFSPVAEAAAEKDKHLLDVGQNYVEATGMAVAPENASGAQAKALARRGAMLDLQRNMLEYIGGVQIDSRTTMDDFMAEDRVRSEVHGYIRKIEVMKGEWDGECYTVTGRLRTDELRVLIERVCGVKISIMQ